MKRTFAVDLAKNVFQVALSRYPGKVAENHRLSRARLLRYFAQQQPATVLMEACSSSHFWARQLQGLGHEVMLLPPRDIRPYRRGNKTDRADAKALLEAARNSEIRPVPVKTTEQQALTALHRLRSTWLAHRTARINTVRGLLREFGHTIPVGARHVLPHVWSLIEDAEAELPDSLRPALAEACLEIRDFEFRTQAVEKQLRSMAAEIPAVRHLRSIPGIGLLGSTALVAFVGDIHRFPSGRHFASYLGLTPREHSSGHSRRLGRITKRGDNYLRALLVHGGRSLLVAAKKKPKPDPLLTWACKIRHSRGFNKAAVALANKLARIVWRVWTQERDFCESPTAA